MFRKTQLIWGHLYHRGLAAEASQISSLWPAGTMPACRGAPHSQAEAEAEALRHPRRRHVHWVGQAQHRRHQVVCGHLWPG